ncbi:LysR family transcriptional regulator [Saccharopolyspora sp. ASAGF58]|uniref:LysR family transcriptional regulator n=1 Tax=Saccharopolyspora sp. ASAGF58 TaxID=2719023 RepID=UPI00143FC31A|nr:LysR family transcriptional regulator [Saccharopolyspora sp. ASAGF58]QIZ37692.1 LysR family transcriptional regulator [Saccharopolyspora sp. ASAGF58]
MHQYRASMALCPNLLYLSSIVEYGSFAAAAAELRMTPSTLSRGIRRLENELGMALVLRSGRSIELTPAGRLLAEHSRLALRQVRIGLREARLTGTKLVRVGLLRSLGSDYMPAVVGSFAARWPDVEFSLREGSSDGLAEMLVEREIDVAMIAPPPERPEIAATVLFEQRIDVVVAAGTRLAGRASLDVRELAGENLILSESGYAARAVADRMFESVGLHPKVIFETDNMEMAVSLAAAGVGVAVAPPTARGNDGVVRVPLTDPAARRDVAVCRLAGVALARHVADFLDHVTSYPAGA